VWVLTFLYFGWSSDRTTRTVRVFARLPALVTRPDRVDIALCEGDGAVEGEAASKKSPDCPSVLGPLKRNRGSSAVLDLLRWLFGQTDDHRLIDSHSATVAHIDASVSSLRGFRQLHRGGIGGSEVIWEKDSEDAKIIVSDSSPPSCSR